MGFFGLTEVAPQKPMGGGDWILPAGAYVCRIERADMGRTMSGKDKVTIEWSVIEGERAGFGTNTIYPPTETIVLDPENRKTLGFAAYKLNKITEGNPGMQVTITNYDGSQVTVPFDAVSLVDNKQVDLLRGALIGLLVAVEDYTKTRGVNAGQDGERNFVSEWLTPQEVRQGFTVEKDGTRKEIVPPPRRDSRKKAQAEPAMIQAPTQQQSIDPGLQGYVNNFYQQQQSEIPF